jgi:hypothetical protein
MLMASSGSVDVLPKVILGTWRIGQPFDTPQPAGLTAKQETYIRSLSLRYTADTLTVCGKKLSIQPTKVKALTDDDFLQSYGFLPKIVGLQGSSITDVSIHSNDMMNACGEYESPGVHLLLGKNNHVVMEVANEYFPLKKVTPEDSGDMIPITWKMPG